MIINKNIYLISLSGLIFAGLSWFFVADSVLVGHKAIHVVFRGFPFHFTENSAIYGFKFLFGWFVGNILFYFAIIGSFYNLFNLWLKEKKLYPLISGIVFGIILLCISIWANNSCVSGFPIEFYLSCSGDSDTTILFMLYGWIVDFLFWFCISSISVVIIYNLFTLDWFREFLKHKAVLLSLRTAWIIITLISLLGIFGDAKEAGMGLILSLISIPGLKKLAEYYKTHEGIGKRLFFSQFSYVVAGIFLGLILESIVFNLAYEGGWFDFTDFGFVLLTYPLSYLFSFEFNSDVFTKRLLLYAIVFVNFFVVTYVIDLLVFIIFKIIKLMKNSNQ